MAPERAFSFSLKDTVVALFRRKWLILFTFLTTASASVGFAVYMPDRFESRMKFLVRNMRSDVQITPDRDGAAGPDRGEVSEAQIISEIELLKSRDLLEQVVNETSLARNEFGHPLNAKELELAVHKLEKDLRISPVKKANIIEVNYTSKDPETAADVLEKLSEFYLNKHLTIHRPPGTYEFFKKQSDQYKEELREAENNLTQFEKQRNLISIDTQKTLNLTKFSEVQARLNDLNGQIRETERRIEEIEKQLASTDKLIVTQNRTLPNQVSEERLNTMLVELRNQRIQLLAKYQPGDRLVREVDDQIRSTTEALNNAKKTTFQEQASEINPLWQSLQADLAKAKVEQNGRIALRKNLTEQVQNYGQELTQLEGTSVVHDNLTRQVTKAEDSYNLYAKKQEESRIADALDAQKISNVSIAEAPTVPKTPFKSDRSMTAVLGIIAGLFLGLGSAFVAELNRETVHTPRELEAMTGVPVLATVPLNFDLSVLNEREYEDRAESKFIEEGDPSDEFKPELGKTPVDLDNVEFGPTYAD